MEPGRIALLVAVAGFVLYLLSRLLFGGGSSQREPNSEGQRRRALRREKRWIAKLERLPPSSIKRIHTALEAMVEDPEPPAD